MSSVRSSVQLGYQDRGLNVLFWFDSSWIEAKCALYLFLFDLKRKHLSFEVFGMGCTVSGVERKHFEGFVLSQESAVAISITNNREYFPMCGKEYTALKDRKRSTNLDKIELLRTAESTRTFITKKIKKSPKMTTLSNAISNEINARVTSNTGQNKELFEGVDRICEANKTGQTVQGTVILCLVSRSYVCRGGRWGVQLGVLLGVEIECLDLFC